MDAAPAPGIFSQKGAYARVMEWSMRDPAFKAQLFRFVDVLPSLTSSAEIVRHLREYLGDQAVGLNPAMKAGLAASSFAPALVAGPVKANVVAMAAQFVAGETPADLVQRLRQNTQLGFATTMTQGSSVFQPLGHWLLIWLCAGVGGIAALLMLIRSEKRQPGAISNEAATPPGAAP